MVLEVSGEVMGCVCCKAPAIEDDSREGPPRRVAAKVPPAGTVAAGYERRSGVSSSSRREDAAARVVVKEAASYGGKVVVAYGNGAVRLESSEKKRERQAYVQHLRQTAGLAGSVPRAVEGEQVAAGWPSWLASVAGEAIRGWVPRRADSFEKLDKVSIDHSQHLI